jgi:biopolymer transport protein ExbB/TolQ
MEILYFVLGVSIALLVLVVIDVFTIKNKLEKLEEEFQFHERGTHDVTVDLHRRIDDEVRKLYFQNEVRELYSQNELRELHTKIDENKREIISLLDSEVYRLTNKINKQQLPKG